MKKRILLFLVPVAMLLFSCNSGPTDEEIETKSNELIKLHNPKMITTIPLEVGQQRVVVYSLLDQDNNAILYSYQDGELILQSYRKAKPMH